MSSRNQGRIYQPLTTRTNDTLLNEIPPLRFEGANVIISLSKRPEDVLLVHSALLKHSKYFQTGLSYRWSTSGRQISNDPHVSPKETTIHKYGLVLDAKQEGYTLAGNSPPDEDPISEKEEAAQQHQHIQQCWQRFLTPYDVCPEPHRRTGDFHRSTYCQSMPSDQSIPTPVPIYLSQAHRHAVRDHKILFAMLYQINVNFEGLDVDELVTCMANVAAYAEYYGLLPFVAKFLEYGLHHRNAGKLLGTSLHPEYWVALGYMLRSEAIFADAMRHFVGGDLIDEFAKYNPEWQDVILLTYKKQLEIAKRISLTDHDLYHLTLVGEAHGPYTGISGLTRFTFLSEDKKAKKIKSEEAKARFLARKALAEWLADNLSKPHAPSVPRHRIYPKLLTLATEGDISMFGAEAPWRLSSIFNLQVGQSKRPPQLVIEIEMRRALREVKEVLERRLFPKDCPPALLEPEADNKYATRQYYLTHMSFTSEEMPWADLEAWKPITPDFEVKAASKTWLEEVGLGHLEAVIEGDTEHSRAWVFGCPPLPDGKCDPRYDW